MRNDAMTTSAPPITNRYSGIGRSYRLPNACASTVIHVLRAFAGPCSLGAMTDGLDVVAIGIADERAVVVGVVLRPHPGLVQHLCPRRRPRRRRTRRRRHGRRP